MGQESLPQGSLFHYGFNLDKRIREDHPLRKIDELIDFDFVYKEVSSKYGRNGNVSVPPPLILKLMLLLVFYNVRSERELMKTLSERLDWLWFLGYDLDSRIPDHSVLSKARKRWGVEVFEHFFERIVFQCVEAGLVDGEKIFVDSSLIDADASSNSVVDMQSLKRYLRSNYREFEKRLSDCEDEEKKGVVNSRYISTTDPDASIVRRGERKICYQAHRSVDSSHEVITATDVTTGALNESQRLNFLMDSHKENTGVNAEVAVADSKYGTVNNFLSCFDRGVKAHIPDLKKKQEGSGSRSGIYSEKDFIYDESTDRYMCPAGKSLKPRSLKNKKQSMDYAASKEDCEFCKLRSQCTRSKTGRTVKRYFRQKDIDKMRCAAGSYASKKDIILRKSLMERSFARGTRYGFDRARWRRQWRVSIQEYLTAAIQNIEILIKHGHTPGKSAALEIRGVKRGINGSLLLILQGFISLKNEMSEIFLKIFISAIPSINAI